MRVTVGTFKPTEKMWSYFNDIWETARISYGPFSRKLEDMTADLHGCRWGVLSNSGTSSLQVAVQALKTLHGWKDGAEVIVPSLTFCATVNVILHNRLKPVLVDVDPDYYDIEVGMIDEVATKETVAIMPVHLFGQQCNMPGVMDRADRMGLKVIEDSCETMFAGGTKGDIACFSFYIAHLITGGVGGCAITNNADYAQAMRSLCNHGLSLQELPSGEPYDPTFLSRKFRFDQIGHSYRITEFEAALALAQMEEWEPMIAKRRENAATLTGLLKDLEIQGHLTLPMHRGAHSWMMYPIVLNEPKWNLMRWLSARNIECREMVPLTNQPCYAGMFKESDYPVSANINRRGLYVGCHQDLTTEQLEYVADAFYAYFAT